jgi:hypothetical protein
MRTLFAAVAALVGVTLVAGCSSDSRPVASTASSASAPPTNGTTPARAQRTSACEPVPPPAAAIDWLPPDLPLPAGSYAVEDTESAPSSETDSDAPAQAHRGFVAVRGTVDDFKNFVRTTWPANGWTLGRGDAEPGEAEGGYRKGDFGGAYRVRDVYCDPTMSQLLITYGKGATTP